MNHTNHNHDFWRDTFRCFDCIVDERPAAGDSRMFGEGIPLLPPLRRHLRRCERFRSQSDTFSLLRVTLSELQSLGNVDRLRCERDGELFGELKVSVNGFRHELVVVCVVYVFTMRGVTRDLVCTPGSTSGDAEDYARIRQGSPAVDVMAVKIVQRTTPYGQAECSTQRYPCRGAGTYHSVTASTGLVLHRLSLTSTTTEVLGCAAAGSRFSSVLDRCIFWQAHVGAPGQATQRRP